MKTVKMSLSLIFSIFLLGALQIQAATIDVYHTDDLQTEIDNASAGDTLNLIAGGPADYHLADEVVIDKDLTIVGDSSWVWVNASGADHAFYISSGVEVTLSSLRIMGAYGDAGILNYGTLEIDDCQIDSNNGTLGGVACLGGDLTITDSLIASNQSSSGYGGGVTVIAGSATLSYNAFFNNQGYLGGAFHNSWGDVSADNNDFNYNSASNKGGVYSNHNTGGTVTYDSSNSETGNSATNSCDFYYDVELSPSCVD